MTWKTFGHEEAKKILNLQQAAGSFPHAYLFIGQEGVGKKTLALEFASRVLGLEAGREIHAHPDFVLLDQPGEISVETVREFMEKLSFTPFVSRHKVAIINNAQNLNVQSSNALLKTLEEPSSSSIIILVSSSKLMPTVMSRCFCLNFNRFSLGLIRRYAQSIGLKADNQILSRSFGSVGRLLKLASAEQKTEKQLNIQAVGADKILQIADLSALETPELKEFLSENFFELASSLSEQPENALYAQRLLEARNGLDSNFNKKLVLQKLFLSN